MPGHKAALGLTIIVAYSFMLSSSPELCGMAQGTSVLLSDGDTKG